MTFTSFLLREVDTQLRHGQHVRFVETRNHRSAEVRGREASAASSRHLRKIDDAVSARQAPAVACSDLTA